MSWKGVTTPRPYLVAEGEGGAGGMLASAFGILAGRSDNNTLEQLLTTTPSGRQIFINDDCWWQYTDFQCHFHALYGWRPFCNAEMRRSDFSTWSAGFLDQVTEEVRQRLLAKPGGKIAPPIGWLGGQYSDDEKHFVYRSPAEYYNNCLSDDQTWAFEDDVKYPGQCLFSHSGEHDLNTDYPLMNCISATDWMLWERNADVAREYLPGIELFLRVLRERADDSGFFFFGPQSSQIEWGHGGWRRQSSTHLYCWKVLANVAEVYEMLGKGDKAEHYRVMAAEMAERVERFKGGDCWLVSGYNEDFSRTFGSGRMDGSESDYLEVWPNVNAGVIGFWNRGQCRSLAERFENTPPLVENHLTISNYPARPAEELDGDHGGFPAPGVHLNGGFHWMHAGSALGMYTRGGMANTLVRMEELLEDHRKHLSVDYYNDWGRNKESQFPEHSKNTHSVTCAGAFGHFFRSCFDLAVGAKVLRLTPASLPELHRLEMLEPVRWGAKELLLSVAGCGELLQASLDGRELELLGGGSVEVPFEQLGDRARLEFKLG